MTQHDESTFKGLMTFALADGAAYDWNSAARHIAVSYAAALCAVSLPAEADVTLWPPGLPMRDLYKLNTSAFGVSLVVAPTCTINGGGAGDDMNPIPGMAGNPSSSVLAQWVRVYRHTATDYYVFGAYDIGLL